MEKSEQNTLEKINNGIKNSIILKVVTITVIALFLLIPASSIQSLISERQFNRIEAVKEVSSKWGGEQELTGPYLTVPYKMYYKSDDELKYEVKRAHFLPEKLNIDGEVTPNSLKRGIYEVVLYNTKLNFTGVFSKPDFSMWNVNDEDILWDDAYLSIGIPDMSGVKEQVNVLWDKRKLPVEGGVADYDIVRSGITARVALSNSNEENHSFNFTLDLNGNESLSFIPLGESTDVNLKSSWADPSFSGNFLPTEREVSDEGFEAKWKIFSLNRNFPQQWINDAYSIGAASFGVHLMLPVDDYQKNMRSAKYAMLIIAFTFAIFFLVEILNKKKFHPFQYVLVGLAIVLFYSLLLSFSEHTGFNVAYLISSAAVVALISVYISAVFKQIKITLITTILLSVIYFFIYIILQLQDFALLVGSVGLFVALACVMYFSRNIDWYNINKKPVEGLQ
ncbi:cell envelope integrity protein CreD [Fulvivirga sediminis]|uniref:Cell envelope integrity protein CreD n=1 Tax=Fulvivirga sediminis TaxID=2803949 RepID=A0A937JYZ8_9BACT|nr:cell envelope integrity protein CreD [Fulvivirga sediminis]MBL3654656.1 cell envelope integrity protein CreD [Fulvivirga sediminis]